MEKINVVLVLLNLETLEETLEKINLDNVNIAMIVATGDSAEKIVQIGEEDIPKTTFSAAYTIEKKYKNFLWLISGGNEDFKLDKIKSFLMSIDVPEKNIVNLDISSQISATWLANLRHIEEHGADFFATGNEYMRDGLDLNFIPCVCEDKTAALGGVNLADANQDLRQSYLTAQHVFAHVEPGTIKFVLIGLMPYSFRYDNDKDFANSKALQYLFALNDPAEENPRAELFKKLLSDDVKNIFEKTTAAQADLNFDSIKAKNDREFSAEAIADWKEVVRFFINTNPDANFKILKDYIELCLANGAKPVGVVHPFFAATKGTYSKKLLREFRSMIAQLAQDYDFARIDMFDLSSWTFDCFCDMTHLNSKGRLRASSLLARKLFDLIPLENFCDMSYDYFHNLSTIAPKDDYNAFMGKIFNASAKRISRKNKIRVGFVLRTVAEWSGDDLYNLFATNERFEPTIFLCLPVSQMEDELAKSELQRGVEQFKSHGLNVVPMDTWKAKLPAQDVLIFLTPYFADLTRAFRLKRINAKTLIAYIAYTFSMSMRGKKFYNRSIFNIAWKVFVSSIIELNLHRKMSDLETPRSSFSGCPRIDPFFKKESEFKFDWKLARPDAKKIIWAPHWSINAGVKYATFQWNHKFMYEFAKAHPEISWVVKPHSALAGQAVAEKLFPSIEAFKEYMQKWDDLPNAQVFTGDYYQDIFATSDGMIQDCASFIAEYQYVDKPMIYLTREGEIFNDLGNEILKASYTVNGKNLDEIAATIQKVFIEGDDYKAQERKEVFDKYLNYPKANGMLASEFIYKSIADKFK